MPIDLIPGDLQDIPDLITAVNQSLNEINQQFTSESSSQSLQPQVAAASNVVQTFEDNAFDYSNPTINVYSFLDPLYLALRTAQVLVSQAQVQANAVGTAQIQAGAVVANSIAASTITGYNIAANTITASNLNVSTLSAITANLGSITSGNITLDSSGYIRGGATSYGTGTGFWMGYNGGAYCFYMGNSSNYIEFNGTTLSIVGAGSSIVNTYGMITITAAPNTAGLYLGGSYMGYSNGSSWMTYMDSSGDFYLGGVSGALSWNASAATLTIQGTSVFKGSVLIGTGSGQISINTGLFSVGGGNFQVNVNGLEFVFYDTTISKIVGVMQMSGSAGNYQGTIGLNTYVSGTQTVQTTFYPATWTVNVIGTGSGSISYNGSYWSISSQINTATIYASTISVITLSNVESITTGTLTLSGNLSVTGTLSAGSFAPSSMSISHGATFNPGSNLTAALVCIGNYGGGIVLQDTTYAAGMWTDNFGANLHLAAGGSSSLTTQLTISASGITANTKLQVASGQVFQLGTGYVSNSSISVTGYLTVQDSYGTTYQLMVGS